MKKAFQGLKRGFTLIELIITIVIIGILAAVAVVGYSTVVDRSETAAAETTLRSIDREYRALDAFNNPADGSVGVDIDDMTPIDGVDFTAADANGNGNGLLESGEVIEFAGSSIQLRSAGLPGIIGAGDGGGETNVVTPIVPFQVSYDQQAFSTSGSLEVLTPTVLGADGTVTYSYTGDLPTGVSFDTATGTFTGPPAFSASATAVSVGRLHTCALLSDGTVECWGQDNYGQSSDAASVENATAVSAGGYHTCALLSDGTVECWGQDTYGQSSDAASVENATAVAESDFHTCALLSDGTVECWGRDDHGQATVPSSVVNATAVSGGNAHTCALLSGNTVECWGRDNYGQSTVPSSVVNATAVSAGLYHTCAVLPDGTVECWGSNVWGQSTVPSSVVNATAVSLGLYHTCALLSDGTVECWGQDYSGQASDAASVENATAVSAGGRHSCAVLSDGTVECWGQDTYGQSTVPAGLDNPGFPASIEVSATDGTGTATATVELTLS